MVMNSVCKKRFLNALLFLFSVFLHNNPLFGQAGDSNISIRNIVFENTAEFIDSAKNKSFASGKYSVYIVKFNKLSKKTASFTIGYIEYAVEMNFINYHHLTTIEAELVLFEFPDTVQSDYYIECLSPFPILEKDIETALINKLYPPNQGMGMGPRPTLLIDVDSNGLKKEYYSDWSNIPIERFIYNDFEDQQGEWQEYKRKE